MVVFFKENSIDPTVYAMIPFYMMYHAFVPLHAKFAVPMFRIGLRYRSLNTIIGAYAAASVFEIPFINSSKHHIFFYVSLFQQINMGIFVQIISKPRTSFIVLSEFMIL